MHKSAPLESKANQPTGNEKKGPLHVEKKKKLRSLGYTGI
jgi:hypothetical protein